jgi:hypothetical protein
MQHSELEAEVYAQFLDMGMDEETAEIELSILRDEGVL